MNLPNLLTSTRLVLAPLFFVLVFLPQWTGAASLPVFIVLAVIFVYIEITDIVDGHIARSQNMVTDLGKVLDPFSDVISRVSYFLAFVVLGIMPPASFLLILYRELGIVFVRMILAQRGITLAARKGGKVKSVLYFVASVFGLIMIADLWFDIFNSVGLNPDSWILNIPAGLFWLSALFAIGSFVDYLLVFRKHLRKSQK